MRKSKRAKALNITKKVKDRVWERDGHRCIICKNSQAMPNAHYISRAQGGLGIEQNVVTLCMQCHYDFDHRPEEYSEPIRLKAEEHLKANYPGWREEDLYYKKEF